MIDSTITLFYLNVLYEIITILRTIKSICSRSKIAWLVRLFDYILRHPLGFAGAIIYGLMVNIRA